MRYSTSVIAAIVISFFLFLGMSILITNKNTYQSSEFEITNFNMIKELESPIKVKSVKPEIPEKDEVKQPPAAPNIEISQNMERPENTIAIGRANINNMELDGIDLLTLPNIKTGDTQVFRDGNLVCIVCMQPDYPYSPARAGIEGWVKVEFTVNKLGIVSDAKVIDSQPKRTFDQASLRAIYKSKFKPLVVDGIPMAQTAIQVIEFKLDK